MRMRKENILLNVALGAGLYALDSLRHRLANNVGDLNDRAREHYGDFRDKMSDAYETASDRVGRASDVLRGEDHSGLGTTASLLIGAGIGFGLGMLFAPASGEETRSNIADKVRSFSREGSTGTYGS